jgi:hypothetical protein
MTMQEETPMTTSTPPRSAQIEAAARQERAQQSLAEAQAACQQALAAAHAAALELQESAAPLDDASALRRAGLRDALTRAQAIVRAHEGRVEAALAELRASQEARALVDVQARGAARAVAHQQVVIRARQGELAERRRAVAVAEEVLEDAQRHLVGLTAQLQRLVGEE